MEVYHCRLTVCGLFFRDFQQRLMYDEVKPLDQILLLWWVKCTNITLIKSYLWSDWKPSIGQWWNLGMHYSSHGGKWSVYDGIWVLLSQLIYTLRKWITQGEPRHRKNNVVLHVIFEWELHMFCADVAQCEWSIYGECIPIAINIRQSGSIWCDDSA